MRKQRSEILVSRRTLLCLSASVAPILVLGAVSSACAMQSTTAITYAADFRAFGFNDRQVLQAAFAAWANRGGALELERGRVYDLGDQHSEDNVFVLFGLENARLAGNGATLQIRTSGNVAYNLLYLAYYRNLRIENLKAIDTGYRDSWQRGAKFIVLDTGDRDSLDITLDNVVGERLLSFVQAQGPNGASRVRGIRIEPNCSASRVFYALNCQNQGDDVTGGFTAINCGRAYFPYGVSGHDLTIQVHHDGRTVADAAESAVLIKSYGRPTSNIRLDATFSGVLPWMTIENGHPRAGSCVSIEHQHDPGAGPSVIENVDITIDIAPGTADPYGAHRLVLRSYLADGREESGPTRNIWSRIRIGGNLRPGNSPAIYSHVSPTTAPEILVAPGTIGAATSNIAAPGFRFRSG